MKKLLYILILIGAICSARAQEQIMVQLKALDRQLIPYPDLELVINNDLTGKVDKRGIAFIEISTSKLPPKSVTVLNKSLEVESWNYSKGIIEVVVREMTHKRITAVVRDHQNQPIPKIKVVYHGEKPVSLESNNQGIIVFNVLLEKGSDKTYPLEVGGYQIVDQKFAGGHGYLKVVPIPVTNAVRTNKNKTTNKNSPDRQLTEIDSQEEFKTFNLERLDSIQSLTVFYAVIRNVSIEDFNEDEKRRIDAKFYELISKWEDSLHAIRSDQFKGRITDSSLVRYDVSLLLEQALREREMLDRIRSDFESSVSILNKKLADGGTNLSDGDQAQILDGIARLYNILNDNEQKFYQNQALFRNMLKTLAGQLSSIGELEEKLFLSEFQREQETIAFNKKFMTTVGIALALALFGIISFIFTKRYKKQKNQLAKANAEVQRVNEHLEELVAERTAQLQETNLELDTFLYKSSHDLRRPLTSIVGLSNIAQMTLKEDALELFEKAANTARNMDRMLKKLINVSEINNPSQYSPINFPEQIEKCIHEFNDLIAKKNIEITSNIQTGIEFNSYPGLIDIIIKNLVENAVWFSSLNKNGFRPKVSIDVAQVNGEIAISLTDNGPGVDKAISSKIWDMFFVGHEKSTGNGLGLYLTRKAVRVLEGTVQVQSGQDRLTRFEVHLPVNGSN